MYIFKVELDGQCATISFDPENVILTALSEANSIIVRGNNNTVIDLGIESKFVTNFILEINKFLHSDFLSVEVNDNELKVKYKDFESGELVSKIYK